MIFAEKTNSLGQAPVKLVGETAAVTPVTENVGDGDGVGEGVGVGVGVGETLGDAFGDVLGLGLGLADGDADGLGVGLDSAFLKKLFFPTKNKLPKAIRITITANIE